MSFAIMSGVSFVLCCHNSERLLPVALGSIFEQKVPVGTLWEVLVVDNASTDNTAAAARSYWASIGGEPHHLKVITETRLGVGFARYRGIEEACFDYVIFVDDDNQLDPDFLNLAVEFMNEHPRVGACGSMSHGVFEVNPPDWFGKHRRSFAVGDQADAPGDVTWTRGILWTAGMVLRKSAIQGLLKSGFKPVVTGAKGKKSQLRSEDSELCLALRLAGWILWYEPNLKLSHFMPRERLNWGYLRKLIRGVGHSHAFLIPYHLVTAGRRESPSSLWRESLAVAAWNTIKKPRKLILTIFGPLEGDPDALWIVRSFGLFCSLLNGRRKFQDMINDLRTAAWVQQTEARCRDQATQ